MSKKYIQEKNKDRAKLYNAISKVMPNMGMVNGPYGWL
jgi:hypothetical protein